jgi:tetratricopeptide (TPR) repeat protein
LPTYDGFELNIERVDAFKYLVIHALGGVYVDLDTQALQPLGPFLAEERLVFTQMAPVDEERPGSLPFVANGFIAGAKQHPFLLNVLQRIQEIQLQQQRRGNNALDPNLSTGNVMLMQQIALDKRKGDDDAVSVWGNTRCYPFNWETQLSQKALQCKLGLAECKQLFPGAVSVDFFHHSWKTEDKEGYSWREIERWLHNALVVDGAEHHSMIQLREAARLSNMSLVLHPEDPDEWARSAWLHSQCHRDAHTHARMEGGIGGSTHGDGEANGVLVATIDELSAAYHQYHTAIERFILKEGGESFWLPDGMITLADLLLQLGRREEAHALMLLVRACMPRERDNELAKLYDELSALLLGEDLHDQSAELKSARYSSFAVALRHQELHSDSAAMQRKAVEFRPDASDVRNNYGVLLQEQGRQRDAAHQFRVARRLAPDHQELGFNLAVSLVSSAAPLSSLAAHEAVGALEAVVAANPKHLQATSLLQQLRVALGQGGITGSTAGSSDERGEL